MSLIQRLNTSYNSLAKGPRMVILCLGLFFLWSTGLLSIVAFIWLGWMVWKWFNRRKSAMRNGMLGTSNPAAGQTAPSPPITGPQVQKSSPPPTQSAPNRPTIDWKNP